MDHIAVEDFQNYHTTPSIRNHRSSYHSPEVSQTAIEDDFQDDEASLSGSAHHSSGPDEAVFDKSSIVSSPRTSHGSDDDLSVLEHFYSSRKHTPPPFTPLKTRSPFRAPSSVRAMQTDITPPRLGTPKSQQRPKIYTSSRQNTPRSVRSHHSAMHTPSKLSPGKRVKKEYPLVLLHITLLPLPLQYTPETLEAVLPPPILANWKLIREKATQTVVERGVLIPHPREDYDLLEERLLEALELKPPRILKCGHFHLSPDEEADLTDKDSDHEDSDAEDADICEDCGRRVRDGRLGDAGTGSKRWDIKIFAANGLMRAGAWGAAWREMERVDVEILPWMEECMKQELELRREEEERHVDEQEQAAREEGVGGLDDERLREIYGQNAQDYVDGLLDEDRSHLSATKTSNRRGVSSSQQKGDQHEQEIPLWDLLKGYLVVAAQDRRNIVIFVLSAVLLFMSMSGPNSLRTSTSLQTPGDLVTTTTADISSPTAASLSKGPATATNVESEAEILVPELQNEEAGEEEEQISMLEDSTESALQDLMED